MSYRILVAKRARTLDLILDGHLERRYSIALGRNAAADKSVEGDHATPKTRNADWPPAGTAVRIEA
jgi:hypothetical protein